MEFLLTLAEAVSGLTEQPTADDLEFGASSFLIPLEYQTLRRILCPRCRGHAWETVMREALLPHTN